MALAASLGVGVEAGDSRGDGWSGPGYTLPDELTWSPIERSSVVLALGGGRFQPVDVVTGMSGADMTEILSGIAVPGA